MTVEAQFPEDLKHRATRTSYTYMSQSLKDNLFTLLYSYGSRVDASCPKNVFSNGMKP